MARICVPVCVAHVSELAGAIREAVEVADVIELRLDYIAANELADSVGEIRKAIESSTRPVILTLRPAEQGGRREISAQDRLRFTLDLSTAKSGELFRDIELDLASMLQAREDLAPSAWDRVICSHHNFTGVPANIDQIYAQMAQTRAHILKLAVHARDATDCLPIFHLLNQAKREGREFIGIAMGPAGASTRILGPSRGSYLTYGSFDKEQATAPGQLTASELRNVYRIDQISRDTEIFGIVGSPVQQSLSPYMHNAAFAVAAIDAVYIPFETRDVQQFIRRMVHPKTREIDWQLNGLSVTIPHKSAVMPLLDEIDDIAREIGAVNTISVRDDRLVGGNTDAAGFISPLRARWPSLANARCAVIGAGGAARAALWSLGKEGAAVTLFARAARKASPVGNDFGVAVCELDGADFSDFDLVVNATPLGAAGVSAEATPVTAAQLAGVRLAYDLVYNPIETQFLREAREAGCDTLGGLEMLIAQAIEQFKLWTGRDPDENALANAARLALAGTFAIEKNLGKQL